MQGFIRLQVYLYSPESSPSPHPSADLPQDVRSLAGVQGTCTGHALTVYAMITQATYMYMIILVAPPDAFSSCTEFCTQYIHTHLTLHTPPPHAPTGPPVPLPPPCSRTAGRGRCVRDQ